MQVSLTLDCSGMRCPRPIVEMAKRMRHMAPGEVLELIATDPVARNDVPAWCRRTGNELVDFKEDGGALRFYVKKQG